MRFFDDKELGHMVDFTDDEVEVMTDLTDLEEDGMDPFAALKIVRERYESMDLGDEFFAYVSGIKLA